MKSPSRDRTAVLVLSDPHDPCTSRWTSFVEDRLASGEEVYLYFIDRGVLHLLEGKLFGGGRERLKLYACAYGARRYHVPFMEPVVFAGLTVLSNLIMGCTAFVTAAPVSGDEEADWILEESFAKVDQRTCDIENVVVYIRWDPRKSHLPMEGMRIASGLTIAEPAIQISLDPRASALLDLPADDIVDGDKRDEYLEILVDCGVVFYCEGDCTGGEPPDVEKRRVSREETRKIVSTADRLIVI